MRICVLLGILFMSLGLSACNKPASKQPAPHQDTSLASPHAPTDSLRTRGDTLKSLSSSLAVVDHQDTASPRLSIALIDSALMGYDGGDTLQDTVTGSNECIGEDLREIQLRNGLILSGSTYSLYAQDWVFSGPFTSILGLKPGMDSADVLRLLGKPRVRSKNAFRYISAPPEEREADLFEARWTVDLVFEHGKLKVVAFIPSMDDC